MKTKKIKNINKHITNMYKDVDRENKGTVYMFHNTVLNIMLFVNCKDGTRQLMYLIVVDLQEEATGKYS